MNDLISKILAADLIELPFISKSSGCVQELHTTVKGKTNKYPVVTTVFTDSSEECDVETGFIYMIPEEKHIGISYFEDLGSKVKDRNSRMTTFICSFRLVIWLNMRKIGPDNPEGALQMAVAGHLRNNLPVNDRIYAGKLRTIQIDPKRPSPFDRYTYNEAQMQHLNHPYDYFSMRIEYTVFTPSVCAVDITINPVIC